MRRSMPWDRTIIVLHIWISIGRHYLPTRLTSLETTNTIANLSCHGNQACPRLNLNSIGEYACVGSFSCSSDLEKSKISKRSCIGSEACFYIETCEWSCIGASTCNYTNTSTGFPADNLKIGESSCRDTSACSSLKYVSKIGPGSCVGLETCRSMDGSNSVVEEEVESITIGKNNCIGESACLGY